MKKITSIFLSLVLLLGATTIAYAESDNLVATDDRMSSYLSNSALEKRLSEIEDKYDITIEVDTEKMKATKSKGTKLDASKKEMNQYFDGLEALMEKAPKNRDVEATEEEDAIQLKSSANITKAFKSKVGNYTTVWVLGTVKGVRTTTGVTSRWSSITSYSSKRDGGTYGTKWKQTDKKINKVNGDTGVKVQFWGTVTEPYVDVGGIPTVVTSTGWRVYHNNLKCS